MYIHACTCMYMYIHVHVYITVHVHVYITVHIHVHVHDITYDKHALLAVHSIIHCYNDVIILSEWSEYIIYNVSDVRY